MTWTLFLIGVGFIVVGLSARFEPAPTQPFKPLGPNEGIYRGTTSSYPALKRPGLFTTDNNPSITWSTAADNKRVTLGIYAGRLQFMRSDGTKSDDLVARGILDEEDAILVSAALVDMAIRK